MSGFTWHSGRGPRPLLEDVFFNNGRGPELVRAHFAHDGLHLDAIDYRLPHETAAFASRAKKLLKKIG